MSLMGKDKWKYYLSFFMKIFSVTALVIINSYISKKVVNGVVYGEQTLLYQGLYLMVVAILLVSIVSPLTTYYSMYYSKKTIFELRTKIYSHLLNLPKKYFDRQESGKILSRITNDMKKVDSIYSGEFYTVIESFAIGSVSVIITFFLEWRLAIVILVLGSITFLANTLYAKPLHIISKKVQSLLANSTQGFLDLVAGNRIIKLFDIQGIIFNKFEKKTGKMISEEMKLTKKEAEKESINYILSGTFYLGVLGAGIVMVTKGIVDLGTVVAVFSLRLGVNDLFTKFGNSISSMQKSLAGASRVFSLIDQAEEKLSGRYYRFNKNIGDDLILSLDNVKYSYGGDKMVLKGIGLQVRRGEIIALVGRSGAGKSTIMKILLGLYSPTGGEVKITAFNNPENRLKNLRNQFAYVSQNAYLFDGTIEENIKYGKLDANSEEIITAARAANAHDFIKRLSDGYKTKVGENSTKLSGGQRQRIAIARALISDSPILLLDEATSALDSGTEMLVQQAIEKLKENKTTIVIAHRFSTIQKADQINVIVKGKVVARGSHRKLLKKSESYKGLYYSRFVSNK